MTARRDPDRLIHDFLMEGRTELADPVFDVVRATIEHTRQRVVIGPWRLPAILTFAPAGLGAGAVIVVLVVLTQLLPFGSGLGAVGPPTPTPTPMVTPEPTPSPTAWSSIPKGPFLVTGPGDPVPITLDIASPGWLPMRAFDAVGKNDDGLDAPDFAGGLLAAWAWPVGTGINVYADPCQWRTTIPSTPATTPDEIVAAFAAQAFTDATAPEDIAVGGYEGKAITLTVPMSFHLPNASRDEKFADCDEKTFAFYGVEGQVGFARNAQGAGQIEELWILDVDGSIVILDLGYSPATPSELVEELRTLAESATFK